MGNRDKLGNPGRFLIQRCLAVKFHKENGIVATRERDFDSLHPDDPSETGMPFFLMCLDMDLIKTSAEARRGLDL